jgi:hypothetical protein
MTYKDSHSTPGQTAGTPDGGLLPTKSRFAGWLCDKCRWYEVVRWQV